eukprot:TRINITY_DN20188_c0_g1_i1.p2 TRINITY_DN20188_c0_g1~~TRINITY_DN20188_c0_g1_i1.p2  ORF type:complete len:134 (+),score=17.92 TRINITY_DN20188_c0_g1_i1:3-404(+)
MEKKFVYKLSSQADLGKSMQEHLDVLNNSTKAMEYPIMKKLYTGLAHCYNAPYTTEENLQVCVKKATRVGTEFDQGFKKIVFDNLNLFQDCRMTCKKGDSYGPCLSKCFNEYASKSYKDIMDFCNKFKQFTIY